MQVGYRIDAGLSYYLMGHMLSVLHVQAAVGYSTDSGSL